MVRTEPDAFFSGVAVDAAGNLFACGNDGIFERKAGHWMQVIDFTNRLMPDGWPVGSPLSFYPTSASTSTSSPRRRSRALSFTAGREGLHIEQDPHASSAVFEAFDDAQGTWHYRDLGAPAHNNGREAVVETATFGRNNRTLGFDRTGTAPTSGTCRGAP